MGNLLGHPRHIYYTAKAMTQIIAQFFTTNVSSQGKAIAKAKICAEVLV